MQSPEPLPAGFARSSSAFSERRLRIRHREEHERPAQQRLLIRVLHVHGLETERHRQLQLNPIAFLPRPADRRERARARRLPSHAYRSQTARAPASPTPGIRTYNVVSTGDDADTLIVTLLSNG